MSALVASALPSDTWRFVGYLPRKKGEFAALFGAPETIVAFESPNRVAASLAALAVVDGDRPVVVCRELTKLHEEIVRGSAPPLAARYAEEPPRGEVVLVFGGGAGGRARRSRRCALSRRKPRPAARRRTRRGEGERAVPRARATRP